MKKKILCLVLTFAVVFSFMPFFTLQADAFSTGKTIILKYRTVTIKPGKTYKSPVFRMNKRMAVMVPYSVKLKDSKKPKYISKGSLKISLKTSKGKVKYTSYQSLKGIKKYETSDNWFYTFSSIDDPGYPKGKYYVTFKNTSKRTISVKYSVRGYTDLATTAELPEAMTLKTDLYQFVGKIGPGMPLVESVTCDNWIADLDWYVDKNGNLYIAPYGDDHDVSADITVTLWKNKASYKINTTIKGDAEN